MVLTFSSPSFQLLFCCSSQLPNVLGFPQLVASYCLVRCPYSGKNFHPASLLARWSDLQKTYVTWSVPTVLTSPRTRKTQLPLLLCVEPCLQSCHLLTRWSNPLHVIIFLICRQMIQLRGLIRYLESVGITEQLAIIILTCRPISRPRPKYAHATIEPVSQEMFSVWFTCIHC
jgi:hypothetical protein